MRIWLVVGKDVAIFQFQVTVQEYFCVVFIFHKKKTIEMKKLISWVEIPATDFERAVKFYSAVLNIDLKAIDFGEEKMACFPGDEGAISYAPDFKPGRDGVLVSFNAQNDLDGAIERIKAYNGTIIQPKTKIEAEGRGYFALFIDSEGNKVGLYG